MVEQQATKVVSLVDRHFPCDHSFLLGVMERRLTRQGFEILWVMRSLQSSSDLDAERWEVSACILLRDWGGLKHGSLRGFLHHISVLLRLLRLLWRTELDIVFVRNDMLFLLIGWILSATHRVPLVFQLSHLKEEEVLAVGGEQRSARSGVARMLARISLAIRKLLLGRCDLVLPVSESMRGYLAQQYPHHGRMVTFPLGVDPADIAASANISSAVDGPYVIYIGTMAPIRRLDMTMEAFAIASKQIPGLRLVMVGGGATPSDRERLVQLASELQIADCVLFPGQLSRLGAMAIVHGAVASLSVIPPSPVMKTISPTKLMEYMCCGCPVIATRGIREQDEIIEASGGGLLVNFDKYEVAEAIVSLVADPGKASAMGALGQAYILKKRNYDSMADVLASELRKVSSRLVG